MTTTQPTTKIGIENAVAILLDIGRSLRRVSAKQKKDKSGFHTAWHQGKLRTELLTWETDDHLVERQEFSFFGRVVEFRRGQVLRTGVVPPDEADRPAVARSQLFVPHRGPDSSTLQAAATILRGCSSRDLYTQHLLGEVNKTLNHLGTTRATSVLDLDVFADLEKLVQAEDPSKLEQRQALWISFVIVGVCLAVAIGVFYWLWQSG